MDLRTLPHGLTPYERVEERRKRVETSLGLDLSLLQAKESALGRADELNCEQMIGHIPLPVGIAGPLRITLSDGTTISVLLPLATTEGALIASVNRGCKALSGAGGVVTKSVRYGVTRSIAFKASGGSPQAVATSIDNAAHQWKPAGEATSNHLKILGYDIDTQSEFIFLTIRCDTDEAMGMNMVTIAAQAIGEWMTEKIEGCTLITVAGNVDSDKKPSVRTHERGRGYQAWAHAHIPADVVETVLKSSPQALREVADAKLGAGSIVAGAIGHNLHAANVIAALYLATGQDIAHTVEGSLTDTEVRHDGDGMLISVCCPALLLGIRGGGTTLPAQAQALGMLLRDRGTIHPCLQLAEVVVASVLAGELSLLAAQANQTLADAHRRHAR